MPDPGTLGLFALAALALLVIPGPAVLYVVTRSASQGRRAGLVSVLGLHTGSIVHVASMYAVLAGMLAPRLRGRRLDRGLGPRLSGAVYVALGVLAAVAHRPETA
jgi:threonine/homoserine/homoserine lactone efflux protein